MSAVKKSASRYLAIVWAINLVLLGSRMIAADDSGSTESVATLRRPVALVLDEARQRLWVANHRSGSLSLVNLESRSVETEHQVGTSLRDLVAAGQPRRLLAVDDAQHQLLMLQVNGRQLKTVATIPTARYPVSIACSADGRTCYVASLWSRRLTRFDLNWNQGTAQTKWVLDLPFAPRAQVLPGDRSYMMVADAFGSNLAVIAKTDGAVLREREIFGHNLHALTLDADSTTLVVGRQLLNELAQTVQDDVHWGLLMSNELSWFPMIKLFEGDRTELRGGHTQPLGEANHAAGDPSGVAVAADGTVLVTLGGVHEVAIGKRSDFTLARVRVGRRPTAIVVSDDGRRAFIANTFDDSISEVSVQDCQQTHVISLGQQRELSLVESGELLFYDASLSHDGWMSCHSCHTDGHTNGKMNDNFSDGSFGAPKRVLSLLGKAGTEPLAWNGSIPSLADQARLSIERTMQSDDKATDQQIDALVAFMNSLPTPPSLPEARGTADPDAIRRGQALFAANQCNRCHAPPSYTSPSTYVVGLVDELGNSKFNPPSLRGVGQRGPYFHDNRASSLNQVFRKFRHQLDEPLSDDQMKDLIAFLKSL